jgi:hypothetical protein
MDETIDRLRKINQRLHAKQKQTEIDAECAILQAQRPLYQPWEQHLVTEAIDQLQQGNRFPECAPMSQVIAQIDAAIERDLGACRETLCKFNGR